MGFVAAGKFSRLKSSFRRQHHDKGTTFKFGVLLHRSGFLGFLGYFFEQFHPEPGQSDFASPKYDGHFYFVFSFDELLYMADFGLQIMIAGFWADLNFLYLK
jgi:hypothetical protein